ncbi:MAG: hypothetical protein JKY56_10645 [Kofleriaceae bacterium]|nr:hypothetical protein [Kofleriaceae bacterium]
MKYKDSVYDLVLLGFEGVVDGSSALQQAFGVSKEVAVDFVERMPCVVKSSATEEAISPFLAALKEVRARVEIRPSDTTSTASMSGTALPSTAIPMDLLEPMDLSEPLDLMEPLNLPDKARGAKRPEGTESAKGTGTQPSTTQGQHEGEEPKFSATLVRLFRRLTMPLLLLAAVGAFAWWWMSDPPVLVGPSPSEARRVVILLHGYGASKDNLVPLAKRLGEYAPETSFILPGAPHSVGISGKTWYPQFRASSQEAMEEKLSEYRAEARDVVMDIADDLMADGTRAGDIYVGGFSQGASVALDVILHEPNASDFGGLVFLSGGSVNLDLSMLASRPLIRAFVSHGKSDPVLGIGRSNQLVEELEVSGHDVTLVNFEGGHSIPHEVVESLGYFLADL